jgi:hypothetical protein
VRRAGDCLYDRTTAVRGTLAEPRRRHDPSFMTMRRAHGLLLVLGSAALAAGCGGITEPPPIVQVESALQPADDVADPVTGRVAMVIAERQTQIGILVEGGLEGSSLGWRVRNGMCTGSGDGIGPASSFPPIEVGDDGTGAVETIIFRRIATGTTYAAEVVSEPNGAGSVLACAELDTSSN